jgi:hypothetical protein
MSQPSRRLVLLDDAQRRRLAWRQRMDLRHLVLQFDRGGRSLQDKIFEVPAGEAL